jgi:integral membrane protein (TIGR01906 family)
MRVVWAVLSPLLVVAVAVALVTTSLNALLYDPDYYAQGQSRYAVGRTTEYSLEALRPVNRAIVDFFRSPGVSLPGALGGAGAQPDVFNEREVGHMEDVRDIVRLVGQLQAVALVGATAIVAARFVAFRRAAVRWVANRALIGAVITLAAVGTMGALTLVDFGELFLTFHLLSFDNDLWQLDPRRDNLIRFFPFAFWFDATVTVAMRSVLSALLVVVVALWTRRFLGRSTA